MHFVGEEEHRENMRGIRVIEIDSQAEVLRTFRRIKREDLGAEVTLTIEEQPLAISADILMREMCVKYKKKIEEGKRWTPGMTAPKRRKYGRR